MRVALYSYLFVAAGGAVGAIARFALNVFLQRDVEFPWGTFAANLLGCFVMGVVAQLVTSTAWFNDAGFIPDQYRLIFAVGFCGSFTTLSSMMLELNISDSSPRPAVGWLALRMSGVAAKSESPKGSPWYSGGPAWTCTTFKNTITKTEKNIVRTHPPTQSGTTATTLRQHVP